MADVLSIITLIAGIMMSLAYYPQAYKILKYKKAKDVSRLTFLILSLGTIVWSFYGIMTNDIVIMSSFIVGAIGSNSVFILTLIYKKK